MRNPFYSASFLVAALIAGPASADSLSESLSASTLQYDARLRSESVSIQGVANEAHALTWRNRLGVETGKWHGLSALIEVDNTIALSDRYNSGLNGQTQYPGVSDPEVTEINRAQITWTPHKGTSLVLGRQRILIDDGRFLGNSGWRQDEQTHDALRFDTSVGKFSLTTAYLAHINRVQGNEKDWDSESWFVTGGYQFAPQLKVQAFAYDFSFTTDAKNPTTADRNNARAASVRITGARVSGAHKAGDIKLSYGGYYAVETEGRGNPNDFRLEAKSADLSAGYGWFTGRVAYESLGGNGTVGFVTPLASGHGFQGNADAFSATGGLKTHVNGINDLRLSLSAALPVRFKPTVTVTRHDFTTARLGQELGTEWDTVANFTLTPKFSLMFKYADFERGSAAGPASRTKGWVVLQYKH